MVTTNKTTRKPQPETHEELPSTTPAPVCFNCKQDLPEGANFCPYCSEPIAAKVEQPRYCSRCNTTFLHAASYKRSPCCGASLKDRPTNCFERSDSKEEAAIDSQFLICQQGKNYLYYGDSRVSCESLLRPIERGRYAGLRLMTDERDWYNTLFTRPDLTRSRFAAYCMEGAPNVGIGSSYDHSSSPVFLATRAALIWFVLEAFQRKYIDVEGKFCEAARNYFKEQWSLTEERLSVLECCFDESGKEPLYQFIPKYRDYEANLRSQWETLKKQPVSSFPCGDCWGTGQQRSLRTSVYGCGSPCETCNGAGKFPVLAPTSCPVATFLNETHQKPVAVFCSQCSEKNEPDARYCVHCRGKIFAAHVNSGKPAQPAQFNLQFNLLPYYTTESVCHCQECGLACYGLKVSPYGQSPYWLQEPKFCEADRWKLATQSAFDRGSPAYCKACGDRVHASWKHCMKCGKERTPTLAECLPARTVEGSIATRLLPEHTELEQPENVFASLFEKTKQAFSVPEKKHSVERQEVRPALPAPSPRACPTCLGTGRTKADIRVFCATCQGTGKG